MVEKRIVVRRSPDSAVDDGSGASPRPDELQTWEAALNGAALADFHVAQLAEIGGFVWVILEREV